MEQEYYFNIKPKLDSKPVTFRVKADSWDEAVNKARNEAGQNFGMHAHRVIITEGGEMK